MASVPDFKSGRDLVNSQFYREFDNIDDALKDLIYSAYLQGHEEGYNEGFEVGRDEGYEEGEDDGYNAGYDDARSEFETDEW